MPLYKEWNIGDHGLASIWKIEEPESFFAGHTGLQPDIKNEKRRIEHLAGRYLLTHLQHDFPILGIDKDQHDKPRIANNEYYFSISHSWPWVAAVIDPRKEAGIDIQTWHPNIHKISHKFLSATEQNLFGDENKLITAAWCAKEATYKWNGRRGVDFIEDLPILYFDNIIENSEMMIYIQLYERQQIVFVENIINTDFACSYVIESKEWAIH